MVRIFLSRQRQVNLPSHFWAILFLMQKTEGKKEDHVEWRIFQRWIDDQQLLIWSPNMSNRVGGKKLFRQSHIWTTKPASQNHPQQLESMFPSTSILYMQFKDVFFITLECRWQMFAVDIANAIYLFITHQHFPSLHTKTDGRYFDNRLFTAFNGCGWER